MKLSTLAGRTSPLTLSFAGEELHLQFRPGRVTARLEAELRSGALQVPEALAGIVAEWDLTDEDGAPYPITREALAELDIPFLAELLSAIIAGAVPNPGGSAS